MRTNDNKERTMGLFDFFKKKETGAETTEPANDMERWFTDTYALWSEYAGGSWKRIGGYLKNNADASMLRGVLRRDWDIKDQQELLEMIVALLRVDAHTDPTTDAWDYCRATQLAGMGYIGGYFNRAVLTDCCAVAAKVMQQNYNSWEELCESYLAGQAAWARHTYDSDKAQQVIKERRDIYRRLCDMPDGPYRVPWNFNMDAAAKEAGVVYEIVMGIN